MRTRLFLSFALIIVVTLASVVFFAQQTRQEVRAYSFMLRGGMTSSPELVAELAQYYAANAGWAGVSELLDAPGMHAGMGQGMGPGMMAGSGQRRLRLADGGGNFVYDSESTSPQGRITAGQKRIALAIPGPEGNNVGYLLIEGDEAGLLSRLDEIARSAALVAGGVAVFVALVLAYHLVRPIHALTAAAGRMARGDLTQRVKINGSDEIAALGQGFNQMAAALEQAEQNRRSMTADIAHELRTPLAIQRAQLEALQDGIYPPTAENLQPLLDQNTQLTRLVDDLRTLALAEAGELDLERGPADLPDIVRRTLERLRPQAEAKAIDLRLEPLSRPAWPALELDAGRVEQILTNLLSNALRYTPQGGMISVALEVEKGWANVSVRDSGPGIPPQALPRIFERFYRADRSRSRDDGGTGLGLAIARQLARAHGGDLTATNAKQGGAVFTLRLPY